MKYKKTTTAILLVALIISTVLTMATNANCLGGISHIDIKESQVQHCPKGDSIDASIDGHLLTVTFTENLGDVQVEITTALGGPVDYHRFFTPGGYLAYITYTGSYVVTITLENGDEYYGEFDVSD